MNSVRSTQTQSLIITLSKDYFIQHMSITDLKNRFNYFRFEPRFILLLIILVGIVLRIPNLNESLWYDELFSTHVHLPNLKALAALGIFDVHPPFYSALMFVWTALFGDSEISVRTLPMIFGISSIALIYVLTVRFADQKTALLAAFLISVSPVSIWYSQEARSYSALIFFILLVVIARLKLKDEPKSSLWFFIYTIAVFAGVFTYFFFIFYIFLISIILLLENHAKKWRILAVNIAAAFFLSILILIKFAKSAIKTQQSDWRGFSLFEFKQLFFKWFLLGGNSWDEQAYYWWIISIQLIFLAIFVSGLIYLSKKSNRARSSHEIVIYLFTLPLFMLVVSNLGQQGYIERSLITSMPFFFIAIAVGTMAIKNKFVRYASISTIIVVSVATLTLYFNRQDVWTIYKPNPDWRSAALYLKDEINAAPVVPELFTVSPAHGLTYYNPLFKLEINKDAELNPPNQQLQANFWVINEIKKEHLPKLYDKLIQDDRTRFYLIQNRYWSTGFEEWFCELIADARFEYKGIQSFKGLNIYRFELAR